MSRFAVVAGLLLALGGCGADETVVKVVDEGTHVTGTRSGAVTVPLGEKLVVDLGEVNHSIGDGWFLVTPPDRGVLTDEGDHYDPDCDKPGCGGTMTWRFGTAAAGATELTLRYCYRSRPPNCEPMPDRGPADPVEIAVTVS
jgi:predicted secreted protein